MTALETYLKYLNYRYLKSENLLEIKKFSEYRDKIPDFEISSIKIKELPIELNNCILKILPKRDLIR